MILVLIIVGFSFVTGAFFAFLATWLTSKKGNTLADIAKSPRLANAEAIKVEILDKVRIASNYPIVGLYIVAAAIPLGIVACLLFVVFSGSSDLLVMSGALDPRPSDATDVCISTLHSSIQSSGQFTVGLPFNSVPYDVNFNGKDYWPETIRVTVDKIKLRAHINITSHGAHKPYDVKIDPVLKTIDLATDIPLDRIPSHIPSRLISSH